MLFGLDPTLMTMIFSAAVAATTAAAYWWTQRGIPKFDLAQQDLQSIATGFMKGSLHDDDLQNIMSCMANPKEVVESIEQAITLFGKEKTDMTDITQGIGKLGVAFRDMIDAVKKCDNEVTQREMKVISQMIGNLSDPKELAYKIGSNIVINGVDIYKEMAAAYTNYHAKQYEAFGKDIGISVALIFIGASNAAKVNPGAAKVMESMAESNLYPQLSQEVYSAADNKAYKELLAQIAESNDPTSVPDYTANLVNLAYVQQPLVNLATVQPLRIDEQSYIALINLMAQQQQGGYLY